MQNNFPALANTAWSKLGTAQPQLVSLYYPWNLLPLVCCVPCLCSRGTGGRKAVKRTLSLWYLRQYVRLKWHIKSSLRANIMDIYQNLHVNLGIVNVARKLWKWRNRPNISIRMETRINGTKFKLFTKIGHPNEYISVLYLASGSCPSNGVAATGCCIRLLLLQTMDWILPGIGYILKCLGEILNLRWRIILYWRGLNYVKLGWILY